MKMDVRARDKTELAEEPKKDARWWKSGAFLLM
jgi:hypothetical protein